MSHFLKKLVSKVGSHLMVSQIPWGYVLNLGALPPRCRPSSPTESGPIKSRTKHNYGMRVSFFLLLTSGNVGLGINGPANPSTHEASSLGQLKHGLEVVDVSGLNFARQLISNIGCFRWHDSRALTSFSLGSSKSSLRHPYFEAYRKIARKLLMRHLIVVLRLTFHANRCLLARVTGPIFSPRKLLPRES